MILKKIVKDAFSLFDDTSLLKKSVEYAITKPLVILNRSTGYTDLGQRKALKSSFKEIPNVEMNDLQKRTMKILVEDDKKIDNLRGAKVKITTDDDISNSANYINTKSLQTFPSIILKNGPIDMNTLSQIQVPPFFRLKLNQYSSFLELNKGGGGKYTKPVNLEMKLGKEPEGKLKSQIEKMEKNRDKMEKKIFDKAGEEFKLVTKTTVKELQKNIKNELLPFYVIKKGNMQGVDKVIKGAVPEPKKASFLQIEEEDFAPVYGDLLKAQGVNINDPFEFSNHIYSRLVNIFTADIPKRKEKKDTKEYPSPNKSILQTQEDLLKQRQRVTFNYQKCLQLAKLFQGNSKLDCSQSEKDYIQINKYFHASFLQKGDNEYVNVKFGASDEPYPTIEKLVAQMMTRRDLAEKFERLKILEYLGHLQKAEAEMIQDVLHEKLYSIVAKYGPAIEGFKEHVH